MPQTRKASSAKIVNKDATIGSRKRKNDSNNPEDDEQDQINLTTEEQISQENGVNNNSETPPDKKRKTDDQEDHQNNGSKIDHNGDTVVHDLQESHHDLQESHHDHDQEMTEREPDTNGDHYENGDHHKNNGNLTSQISQELEPESEPVQNKSIDTEKKDELAMKISVNTLEKGHVLFLYRPKLGVDNPKSIDDVQRMYMVLIPYLVRPSLDKDPVSSFAQKLSTGNLDVETDANADNQSIGKTRVIIVGKKKLPEINKHECFWGFVDQAFNNLDDIKKFFDPSDPQGRGVYNIVEHNNRTHLAYVLEVPEDPFQLQLEFNVGKKGSYALTVKNPDVANPRNVGLTESEKVKFPEHLSNHFRGRRFISLPTTNFLDYNGAEVLFIGARNDIADELGQEVGGELEGHKTRVCKLLTRRVTMHQLTQEALEKHLDSFGDITILKNQFIETYVEEQQQQTFKMTDKKNSNSKNNKPNKKHHRKTKSLLASSQIMQNFSSRNLGTRRVTLRSDSKPGIFNKGKASEKVSTKGVPDLVFSEVDFLNSRSSKKRGRDQNGNTHSKKRGHDQTEKTHSKGSNHLSTRRVRRKIDKILQSQEKDDDLLSDDSLPSLKNYSIVDSSNSIQNLSVDNSFNENELSQNNDHSLSDNNHSHPDDVSQSESLIDLSYEAPLPHSNSNDHTYPTESPYFVTNLSDDGLPKNSSQDIYNCNQHQDTQKDTIQDKNDDDKTISSIEDASNSLHANTGPAGEHSCTYRVSGISNDIKDNSECKESPKINKQPSDFYKFFMADANKKHSFISQAVSSYCASQKPAVTTVGVPSAAVKWLLNDHNDHIFSPSYSETSALYLNDDALTQNGIDATVDGTYLQTDEEYIKYPNYYSSLYGNEDINKKDTIIDFRETLNGIDIDATADETYLQTDEEYIKHSNYYSSLYGNEDINKKDTIIDFRGLDLSDLFIWRKHKLH
ncbi:22177_t:CDS:2 [Cetraspora pellucida]|uniref:22177_t:CDS:1 n=1 Tax=Cetraspora pellucida TaxID=1433469 RepID=A0A9N8ZLA0_9GLOM|nr:22177_t:CDS:2 [Cetraspora pellucida]